MEELFPPHASIIANVLVYITLGVCVCVKNIYDRIIYNLVLFYFLIWFYLFKKNNKRPCRLSEELVIKVLVTT